MIRPITLSVGVLTCVLLCGCGNSENVVVTGSLQQNGSLYKPEEGEQVMIVFGEERDGKVTGNSYPVRLASDGTFKVAGPDNQGIPAGKYRVGILSAPERPVPGGKTEDKFAGKYEPQHSPIQVEIGPTNKNLTLKIE